MLMVNQLSGLGAKDVPFDVSATDVGTSGSSLTTYTFSSLSLGAPLEGRYIIIGVAARSSSGSFAVSSLTVAGASASAIVTANEDTTGRSTASLYLVELPAGATGDVVVTFNTTGLRCGVQVWRMVGVDSSAVSDTASDTTASGGDLSTTIDVPEGGAAVAVAMTASSSLSWTGLTEDSDALLSTGYRIGSASDTFAAAQSGLTVTVSGVGASQNAMVVGSWR